MPIGKTNNDLYYPVWTPTILDAGGNLLYRDGSSTLSGFHDSYWQWSQGQGEHDIFWVYDSDTGHVFYYRESDGEWIKRRYEGDEEGPGPPKIIREKLSP
jgi:hypothetical protein